jgi:hypothetical protein
LPCQAVAAPVGQVLVAAGVVRLLDDEVAHACVTVGGRRAGVCMYEANVQVISPAVASSIKFGVPCAHIHMTVCA